MKLSFAVGMFGWLLAFLVLSASCGRPCTFTKSDLPVPEDSLIVGDPRKKEECKKTSFKATRPADLFDPAGVRLWTREEDTMAKSKEPFVNRMFMEEMMIDPFIFGQFNRIMGDESKNGFEVKFQLLKNLKAGSTTMVQLLDSKYRADFDEGPTFFQAPISIGSVRHPISRLISAIGTISNRLPPTGCHRFALERHRFICRKLFVLRQDVSRESSMNKPIKDALSILNETGVALSFFEESHKHWVWKGQEKPPQEKVKRRKRIGRSPEHEQHKMIMQERYKNARGKMNGADDRLSPKKGAVVEGSKVVGMDAQQEMRERARERKERRYKAREERKRAREERKREQEEREREAGGIGGGRRLTWFFIDRVLSMHTASQMYLLNLHPPSQFYNTSNDPSVNEIDALVRLEHLDEGLQALKKVFPSSMRALPTSTIKRNKNEGHLRIEQDRLPCSLAWEIYDYYVQDFECLGYTLPEECLKEQCRPEKHK